MGPTLIHAAVVTHARAEAQEVIRAHLDAFIGRSSVLVVAPEHVDSMRAQPAFAGWHVTDGTSRFAWVAADTREAATDELILETSGTTGNPKLVRHAKSALRGCGSAIAAALTLDPRRHYVSLLNPRFAFGLSIPHSHAIAEVPVRLVPAPVAISGWAEFRAGLRPNSSIYLAPHHSYMLAQDRSWRLDGPVELIMSGAPVRWSMVNALARTFPSALLTVMYGQAELGPSICVRRTPIAEFEEGNVGRPLPGVHVRTTGEMGAIEVDSPFRMTSYVEGSGEIVAGTPVATADSRWWPTGDVGFVSPSGDVHVTRRAAADANFLGRRVRLDALWEAARAVPGVLDVRTSVVDHDVYGQRPSLRVLVPRRDAATDSLEREVRRALAAHVGTAASAVLVEIVDLASLPESGKL